MLFDAVGTLIEPAESVGAVYRRIALAHGVDLPASRIQEAFGRIHAAAPPMAFPGEPAERVAALERDWWRAVVRGTFRAADSTVRFDDFDAAFDGMWRHFGAAPAWRLRAGAERVLARLRTAGLATALVSNFDGRIHGILAGLGLAAGFDAVVLPRDAGAAKPEGAIFALALARLGVAPAEACFVGDHAEEDLAAARRAGLRAIDVTSLATLEELPERILSPRQETP